MKGKTFHKTVLPSQDDDSEIYRSIPILTTDEFYMPAQDALAAMWNFARKAGLASRLEDVAVAPKQETAYKKQSEQTNDNNMWYRKVSKLLHKNEKQYLSMRNSN